MRKQRRTEITCAVTAQLISAFVLSTLILLALFCDCSGQFVPDLIGNPEDRFSRVEAHLLIAQYIGSCSDCDQMQKLK